MQASIEMVVSDTRAAVKAWASRDEPEARAALKRLATSARILSRSEPLLPPTGLGQRIRIASERDSLGRTS
jgi:hypothetical protein